MAYRTVFAKIDPESGADTNLEEHIYGLNATERAEAEAEARALVPPEGAEFIKLFETTNTSLKG